MATPDTLNADSVVMDHDPDADLSNADFGDTVAPATSAAAEPASSKANEGGNGKPGTESGQARDANGRFVKTGGAEGATTASGEGAADADGEGAVAAAGGEGAGGEGGAGEGAAAGEGGEGAVAAATDPQAGKNVPYHRFKEVVNQRNELAAKLSEAEAERTKIVKEGKDEIKELTEQRDALYEKVETLRADGDTKGAAAAQREIDDYNLKIADAHADLRARQAAFAATENSNYDAMLDHLETAQPVMDPNSPEFDGAVVREMEFQVQAYEKMGLTPTQALRRAATLIFREDPFAARKAEAKPTDKTTVQPPAAKPEKKPTDVKKNIEAANKTPAQVEHKSDLGDLSGTKSVNDMSDEEFAALPASVLARKRGDMLA